MSNILFIKGLILILINIFGKYLIKELQFENLY